MATLKFIELLDGANLEVKDLPKEIQNKVTGLRMLVGKFNKLCDKEDKSDKEKEIETKLESDINEKDMLLCNNINEWLEQKSEEGSTADEDDNTGDDNKDDDGKTDEDNEDAFEKIENEAIEAEKQKQEQEQKDKEEKEKKDKEQKEKELSTKGKYEFGNAAMEKEILSNVVNNVIQVSVLEKIIGRKAKYPKEKICNIVLEKVYLRNEYRIK